MIENSPDLILALYDNGKYYLRPGLTVGELLRLSNILRDLALNVKVQPLSELSESQS